MSDDKELKAKEELEKRTQHYVGRGYAVVSRTETTAQLVRKKRFSLLACLLLLLTVAGPIFYCLYFLLIKKDKQVYLYIEDGKIKEK